MQTQGRTDIIDITPRIQSVIAESALQEGSLLLFAVGSTAGLTAGFVSWLLRGGSLLASMMSTLPLLNRFDPLSITYTTKRDTEKDKQGQKGGKGKKEKTVADLFDRSQRNDDA